MSIFLTFERPSSDSVVYYAAYKDQIQEWISPNDIGAVAAAVLTDDIEKHSDISYEVIGDVITPNELVSIASCVLERPISYQKVGASAKYDHLMKTDRFSHAGAYHIAASIPTMPPITTISTGIPILSGREPETLEKFISLNKAQLI